MKFSVAGSLGAHREAAMIALDLHAVERRPVQVNKKAVLAVQKTEPPCRPTMRAVEIGSLIRSGAK